MSARPYSFAPSILMITDIPPGDGEPQRLVEAAGGRLRGAISIEEGLGWIDENPPVDAVLLSLQADHPSLDALLTRLDAEAEGGRHAAIVALPAAMIDIVTARLDSAGVTLLVDARPDEIVAGVAAGLVRREIEPSLHETKGDPVRLRQLSEEVGRIARTLAELSSGVGEPKTTFRSAPPPPADRIVEDDYLVSAAMVRSVIRGRRLRDQFFDSRLFADPAWDMLLDLAAARIEGRRVAVSSLCIAAAVPATTALRWIKTLVDEGLFVRVADARDGRRVFIELSDGAADGVRAYFRALARAGIAAA